LLQYTQCTNVYKLTVLHFLHLVVCISNASLRASVLSLNSLGLSARYNGNPNSGVSKVTSIMLHICHRIPLDLEAASFATHTTVINQKNTTHHTTIYVIVRPEKKSSGDESALSINHIFDQLFHVNISSLNVSKSQGTLLTFVMISCVSSSSITIALNKYIHYKNW